MVSLTLVYYFLNETLSSENESPISKVTYTASSPDHLNSDGIAVTPVDQQETTILSILLYPPLRALMSTQFLISILATAYDVVFILVCFTPIDLGGLSRNVSLLVVSVIKILISVIALSNRTCFGSQRHDLDLLTTWRLSTTSETSRHHPPFCDTGGTLAFYLSLLSLVEHHCPPFRHWRSKRASDACW